MSVQASPNVTPMVDVMLVLLIIFMVVAPALLDGFRLEPPNAEHLRAHPNDSGDVVLGIDAGGRYYLNKRQIEKEALADRLASIFTADRIDRVMYVKADRQLDYSVVLEAMDIARNHGVVMLGMIAEPRSEGGPAKP